MLFAEIIVYAAFAYLTLGFLFSIYFSFFAVKKFDESAKDSGIGFRLIIFLGVVAFWVLFAWRLFKGKQQPNETTAHRRASRGNQ